MRIGRVIVFHYDDGHVSHWVCQGPVATGAQAYESKEDENGVLLVAGPHRCHGYYGGRKSGTSQILAGLTGSGPQRYMGGILRVGFPFDGRLDAGEADHHIVPQEAQHVHAHPDSRPY